MKLHDLTPDPGSRKKKKRVGRGEASAGKTSGRGMKGTRARKGVPAGFEGGQMPLARRLPKWGGFTPRNRVEYSPVNVGRLEELFDAGDTVNTEALVAKGAVRPRTLVKILGNGELTKALNVTVAAYSESGAEKIRKAGGTAEVA